MHYTRRQFGYDLLRMMDNLFIQHTAYICVCIVVIFLKINFGARTRISLLICEWEAWEIVSEFELLMNEYYESDKKNMK